MFEVSFNEFTIYCDPEALPNSYDEYRKRSAFSEEFGLESREGKLCFIGVSAEGGWPFLTVAQKYSPAGSGFYPGALLVPETSLLFIGAGERLLAYKLWEPQRLWMDSAASGFWNWRRYSDVVLMAAELEFAAWSVEGMKLWSTYVEPPWTYEVHGEFIMLDVMGKESKFSLRDGPRTGR
jgi:hypothetical protein